ncbi:MAG: hypothetical protein B7Z22_00415 [Hyphomonas sp. 32-62-5]|nr:MAG: hypothetical protein B7Z22_00415 [Hyphomonas sp. 32-62-5]
MLQTGWPALKETTQKFMFVLDEGAPSAALAYRKGHASLKGRIMFANYPETEDEAAFMVYWDIFGHERQVANLVAKGFLVRVSADISTLEARTLDYARLRVAMNSGAQFNRLSRIVWRRYCSAMPPAIGEIRPVAMTRSARSGCRAARPLRERPSSTERVLRFPHRGNRNCREWRQGSARQCRGRSSPLP